MKQPTIVKFSNIACKAIYMDGELYFSTLNEETEFQKSRWEYAIENLLYKDLYPVRNIFVRGESTFYDTYGGIEKVKNEVDWKPPHKLSQLEEQLDALLDQIIQTDLETMGLSLERLLIGRLNHYRNQCNEEETELRQKLVEVVELLKEKDEEYWWRAK